MLGYRCTKGFVSIGLSCCRKMGLSLSILHYNSFGFAALALWSYATVVFRRQERSRRRPDSQEQNQPKRSLDLSFFITIRLEIYSDADLTLKEIWYPQRDLNLRRRREKAVSWAGLDDGDRFYKMVSSPDSN